MQESEQARIMPGCLGGIMRFAPTVFGIVVVFALAGCSSSVVQPPTATADIVASSPKASIPEVTPTPTIAATPSLVFPECTLMNPAAQRDYDDYGPQYFATPAGEIDLTVFNLYAGDAAKAAVATSSGYLGCAWSLNLHAALAEYVVRITPDLQQPLIAALRSDPGITESQIGKATAFTYSITPAETFGDPLRITHLFIGDAWIALFDGRDLTEYTDSAYAALIATNPGLDD